MTKKVAGARGRARQQNCQCLLVRHIFLLVTNDEIYQDLPTEWLRFFTGQFGKC